MQSNRPDFLSSAAIEWLFSSSIKYDKSPTRLGNRGFASSPCDVSAVCCGSVMPNTALAACKFPACYNRQPLNTEVACLPGNGRLLVWI